MGQAATGGWLDVEWVKDKGAEAKVAMGCFSRLTPLLPGAQGVIYDTALRGIHHQELLRELGLLPVNRVTAAVKGAKKPRRGKGRRVEKSVHVEDKKVQAPEGKSVVVSLFARAGAIGIGELSDVGEPIFTPLKRVRTHRIRDKSGRFRWYNDYLLPAWLGAKTVTVRLHATEEDRSVASIEPRTSGSSRPRIPLSRLSTLGATTLSPSIGG